MAVPAELREPEVVFGVDFCEFSLGERDFAVVAELVFIDGQLVPRPMVGLYGIFIGEAELAADIIILDDWPAGLAGVASEGGGILYAVQSVCKKA